MKTLIPTLAAVVAAMLALLCGCSRKEIECPARGEADIYMVFDWAKAPEADPKSMALFFFPLSEGALAWRFDIAGRDGGPLRIPCGKYSLVACNNDRPGVRFTGTDALASVAALAPVAEGGENLVSTGMLYGAMVAEIDVTPCGVSYSGPDGVMNGCSEGRVRCMPDSIATVFTVIVKDVDGLDMVRTATATVAGVGDALSLASGLAEGVPSRMAMQLMPNASGGMLSGMGAGFAPASNAGYSLRVAVRRNDGVTVAKDFPQSSLRVNTLSPHNVIIETEGLDIPSGSTPSDPGGIDVGVDGWIVIETDLDASIRY